MPFFSPAPTRPSSLRRAGERHAHLLAELGAPASDRAGPRDGQPGVHRHDPPALRPRIGAAGSHAPGDGRAQGQHTVTSGASMLFVRRGAPGGGPFESKRARLGRSGRARQDPRRLFGWSRLDGAPRRGASVLGADVRAVIADSASLPAPSSSQRRVWPATGESAPRDSGPARSRSPRTAPTAPTAATTARGLFERLRDMAGGEGWKTLAYGAVVDDLGEVRPGMHAAERLRVRAPLLEAVFEGRGPPPGQEAQAPCLGQAAIGLPGVPDPARRPGHDGEARADRGL
jgi:hypothetical protein